MNKGSILTEGQVLKTDDYLVSPNKDCYVIMQGDGNLCVYSKIAGKEGTSGARRRSRRAGSS